MVRIPPALEIMVIVSVSSACLAGRATAQDECSTFFGRGPYHYAGSALAAVGDADRDGFPDWLCGNPGTASDNPTGKASGDARLISGKDGSVLFSWFGDDDFDGFGRAVAGAGDLDGDGAPDVLVGAPDDHNPAGVAAGTVRAYSGADGRLLLTLYGTPASSFGAALDSAGDLDGDGICDVLVGAPLEWGQAGPGCGVVRAFSGADGTQLLAVEGTRVGETLGAAVAGAGDRDGDGVPDLLMGAPTALVNGVWSGRVQLCSGADGTPLWEAHGSTWGELFGRALAFGFDADRDGESDLVVGAPGGLPHGRAYVFGSATATALFVVAGDADSVAFGTSVAGVGDLDGDGFGEFAVGAPTGASVAFGARNGNLGRALLVSGRTGTPITPLFADVVANAPSTEGAQFGAAMAAPGDLDGDGFADLIVGAPYDDGIAPPHESGSARVLCLRKLFQSAWPPDPTVGETLSLATAEGRATTPTLLVLVELDGVPEFTPLFDVDAFDALGRREESLTIDPSLSGFQVKLRAYAIDANRRLIRSNDEPITLR